MIQSVWGCLVISGLALGSPLMDPQIWENMFKSTLDPQQARRWLKDLTSKPHPAGSAGDFETAQYVHQKWESFGIPHVETKTYWPLLNYPKSRSLKLLEPVLFEASLRERRIAGDSYSNHEDAVPTFFGYGASGNVTGQVVYANFGSKQDFEILKQRGIEVRNKIVLVRYGNVFRGLKVRAAELAGAAGVLIYSDPMQDGYCRGPVYGDGPYRPSSGVQRGSVHYPSFYPGDPLTPGYPATNDAPRVPIEDTPTLPKIPALPISYEDAEPFLKALEGHGKPVKEIDAQWQGGLNLTYYTGPAGLAHLFVDNKFEVKPIWNVIAKIPGELEPDKEVILGNHRDAWVFGAVDPNAGTSVMMEVSRGLGLLYKMGWRPRRTIVFASWDAEEYGLVGSTEWVEEYAQELYEKAIVYINTDTAVSGKNFRVAASPSLTQLLYNVTKEIQDPSTFKSVYDSWKEGNHRDKPHDVVDNNPFVGALGFGSDYVAFLQHVGIASMDIKFEGPYGVYHSNYDNFNWMEKFGDPGFEYHTALASIIGLMVMRLSTTPVLSSFRFKEYGLALERYAKDFGKTLEKENPYKDQVSLTPLIEAVSAYKDAASVIDQEIESSLSSHPRASWNWKQDCALRLQGDINGISKCDWASKDEEKEDDMSFLNDRIQKAERGFLDPLGLPGRPWYKHLVYAPDEWAGYKAEMFPTLRDTLITQGNLTLFNEALGNLTTRIHIAAQSLLPPPVF